MTHFVKHRRALKAKMKAGRDTLSKEEYDTIDITQHAFKLLANGGNGYHGNIFGYFSDYTIYKEVTNTAQVQILEAEEMLKDMGIEIIQLATDGIKIVSKHNSPEYYKRVGAEITKALQKKYRTKEYLFEFEGFWQRTLFLNLKSYVLLEDGQRPIVKGATLRDKKVFRYLRETLRKLCMMLAEGQTEKQVDKYLKKRYALLGHQRLSKDDLLMYQSLSKEVDYEGDGYEQNPDVYYNMSANFTSPSLLRKYRSLKIPKMKGDRITFFFSNQGKTKNQRLKPIELFSPEYVDWERYQETFWIRVNAILKHVFAKQSILKTTAMEVAA